MGKRKTMLKQEFPKFTHENSTLIKNKDFNTKSVSYLPFLHCLYKTTKKEFACYASDSDFCPTFLTTFGKVDYIIIL